MNQYSQPENLVCGSSGHKYIGPQQGISGIDMTRRCYCGDKKFNGLEIAKEIAARGKRTSTKDIT